MEGCLYSDGGGRCRDGERRALRIGRRPCVASRGRPPARAVTDGGDSTSLSFCWRRYIAPVLGCLSAPARSAPYALHPAVSVRALP